MDATQPKQPTHVEPTVLEFDDAELANALFGAQNRHLALIAKESGATISSRGSSLYISASEPKTAQSAANLFAQVYALLKAGYAVYERDFRYAWTMLLRDPSVRLLDIFRDAAFVVSPRKTIVAKSLSQRDYIAALREQPMVFGMGAAGTGKTYLAVAVGLSKLLQKEVKRIILTRPAVEAGEKLGFLPGDLTEKVNPYLRPLYDALYEMLDYEKVTEMLETGVIEIAPLAFMRGRTLNDAFIILDEAQNTTPEQMKMFLTRMGFGSQMVITGDITQIDLPQSFGRKDAFARSGLVQAERILANIEGIHFTHFSEDDVIRHPLVGKIVRAYEHFEYGKK